jgi:hypothetical protein
MLMIWLINEEYVCKQKSPENFFRKLIDLLHYYNMCIAMFVTCIAIMQEEVKNICNLH